RLATVVARDGLTLTVSIFDRGDVAQEYPAPRCARRAAGLGDDNAADLVDRLQLTECTERVTEAALPDRTALCARVCRCECRRDLVDRDAVALQPPAIDIYVDLALEAARECRLRNAVDLLEAPAEH